MPFERPTLRELIDRGAAEFESRLPGVLVRVRRSLVGVLNRMVAGALSSLYHYAEWLNRQVWPDEAEPENLVGHGARWGVTRNAATPATGNVTFTGTNAVLIPSGTVVQRADQVRFTTDADAVIAAGTATVDVTAEVAGQAGNTASGTALQLASPIAGVNAVVTVSTEISGGTEIEDAEAWRSRILARIRQAPQGGALPDYEGWAKEVAGVTRVWIAPLEQGPGTVVVRFTRDEDASPIPDAGEIAAVQDHIDALAPVTATVYVVAPIAAPLDFTIDLTPDTPAVRAAVEAELRDVIRREGKPGGTLPITHLREAVSIAAGERDHVMTSPPDNVTHSTGELPVMGVITWL